MENKVYKDQLVQPVEELLVLVDQLVKLEQPAQLDKDSELLHFLIH